MRLAGLRAATAFAASTLCACDPVYEYCVTVTDCSSEAPLEGVRVRFDHEGLLDQRTDGSGRACSSNVGSPSPHDVHVLLQKDGYHLREVVDVCMCQLVDTDCAAEGAAGAGVGAGDGP